MAATNTPLLLLTHFCEIHGPQTILATRIMLNKPVLSSSLPPSSLSSSASLATTDAGRRTNGAAGGNSDGKSQAPPTPPILSETGMSCANCSYNVPNTTTMPVLRSSVLPPDDDDSGSRSRQSRSVSNMTIISSRVTSDVLIREACTRALSVETVGKGMQRGSFVIDTDIATVGVGGNDEQNDNAVKNDQTKNDSFDPCKKGVNVVHVFRIPDPRARGGRRVYAFVAVGDSSLLAHQGAIIRAFETWGGSIEELSERHLRVLQKRPSSSSLVEGVATSHADNNTTPTSENGPPDYLIGGRVREGVEGTGKGGASLESSLSLSTTTPSPPLSLDPSPGERSSPPRFPSTPFASSSIKADHGGISATTKHRTTQSTSAILPSLHASPASATAPKTKPITPISSFLSAKTVDPDGYPRSSLANSAGSANLLLNIPKTRSLAEIVGDEFFFVRLHAEFCGLMRRVLLLSGGDASAGLGYDGDGDEGTGRRRGVGDQGRRNEDVDDDDDDDDDDGNDDDDDEDDDDDDDNDVRFSGGSSSGGNSSDDGVVVRHTRAAAEMMNRWRTTAATNGFDDEEEDDDDDDDDDGR